MPSGCAGARQRRLFLWDDRTRRYYTNQFGNGYGTVFKISPNGSLTNLYSFTGGNDGDSPGGTLVQGGDGYFYGTTSASFPAPATAPCSKSAPMESLTNLYSFTGTNDGAYPVCRAGAGQRRLFLWHGPKRGRSESLQNLGYGTVFKISTNGTLTNLYSFNSSNGYPGTGLVQGGDGCFYGTSGEEVWALASPAMALSSKSMPMGR